MTPTCPFSGLTPTLTALDAHHHPHPPAAMKVGPLTSRGMVGKGEESPGLRWDGSEEGKLVTLPRGPGQMGEAPWTRAYPPSRRPTSLCLCPLPSLHSGNSHSVDTPPRHSALASDLVCLCGDPRDPGHDLALSAVWGLTSRPQPAPPPASRSCCCVEIPEPSESRVQAVMGVTGRLQGRGHDSANSSLKPQLPAQLLTFLTGHNVLRMRRPHHLSLKPGQ